MTELHPDTDMAAQLERTLMGAYCGAADLGEALATAGRVAAGDYGGWAEQWRATAEAAEAAAAQAAAGGSRAAAARGYLRAAEYWRQSYFFLRHDLGDERVTTGYDRQRDAFRRAMPLLDVAVEVWSAPFDPVPLSGYLYRARSDTTRRPLLLFTGGFDGTAEEIHKYGVHAALEQGWHALVWDGPGQGGLLVESGVTMRPDFEAVLAPVVDWALDQPFIDPKALVVVGRSLGGYLAPRAVSAEHRVAALVCDPGQFDFTSRYVSMFSPEDWQKVLDADPAMDAQLDAFMDGPRNEEFYGSRMAALGATSFGGMLRTLAGYTLAGRADKIRCPTLVTEGEGDFASQSGVLYQALTCPKVLHTFTAAEGAGGHCEGMGQQLWQELAFGWIRSVLGPRA